MCLYLLHMLLQLDWRCYHRGWPLHDLPWSANFLIRVSSQKHSLIKISHRQHVLLILSVYGFTVHTHTRLFGFVDIRTSELTLDLQTEMSREENFSLEMALDLLNWLTCYQWSSGGPTALSNVSRSLSGSDWEKSHEFTITERGKEQHKRLHQLTLLEAKEMVNYLHYTSKHV